MKKCLVQIQGTPDLPTLVYLPGMHGHWSFAHALRKKLEGKVRLVELAYPSVITWTVQDYARSVQQALAGAGVTRAWLLAESFGSQIAWELSVPKDGFVWDGLILDGGFIRHPLPWGARFLAWALRRAPKTTGGFLGLVAVPFMRKIMKDVPMEDRKRFPFNNRNRASMIARLYLIATHDPRPLARRTSIPVYAIAGFWDILVPFPLVFRWLRKNCLALSDSRILWSADHATIMSSPEPTANLVQKWMGIDSRRLPPGVK